MARTIRNFNLSLVTILLILASTRPAGAQGVIVTRYNYAPTVTYYYPAPTVSNYAPPTLTYYPQRVAYYPAPVVSYYSPPVVSYQAAPVTTTYYGPLGRPRATTQYYYPTYVYP